LGDNLKKFVQKGFDVNTEISEYWREKKNNLSPKDYFSFALAASLTWTHHAKDEDDFLEYAVKYFRSDKPVSQNMVEKYYHLRDANNLAVTMTSLRTLKGLVSKIPDFETCTSQDIRLFQIKLLRKIMQASYDERIPGVGPWMSHGPTKVILVIEDRLWKDPHTEEITLPTGEHVIRGARILMKAGHIDKGIKEFLDERNLSTDLAVHDQFKKIAKQYKTMALHINTAAHMLGIGDFTL
jgi:hypothetical protein